MGKLVRDKIPDIIRARGQVPDVRALDDDEYRQALHAKLREEAAELASATGSDRVAEELADVLEVLRAIARVSGVAMDDVARVADQKRADRGAFSARLYLNSW